MKVEKLERLAIGVPNLEEAMKDFSRIFGIDFETGVLEPILPGETKIRCAVSTKGVELVEKPGKAIAVASFHFRVKDLDEATAWVEKNGGTIIGRFSVNQMEEVITNTFGLRIILVYYPGDDPIKAAKG